MGATNGYDSYYMARPYYDLIRQGVYSQKELDQKVRRILRLEFLTAMNRNRPWGSLATPEHAAAARRIACEGMVLLKNEGAELPLTGNGRILVVGENAVKMMTVGGGSSSLKARHEVSPLEGLQARFGKERVHWVRGYVGDTSSSYNGVQSGQDLTEKRSAAQLTAEAVKAAATADCVVFVGGLNKSAHQDCEGSDRLQLGLPYGQDALIEALAAANKHLTVVLVSGNAVSMPWIERVQAVVEAWYSGSEAGNALADIVSGDVNPSGKLPFTFPVRIEDNCATALGTFNESDSLNYKEGVFVGYRWNEQQRVKPLFAFGHGLSYTTFEYGKAQLSRTSLTRKGTLTLTVRVRNTGKRAGAEVVQLYIADPQCSVPRPPKELKNFAKITLRAGESRDVHFTITPQMLAYFDEARHAWTAENGTFTAAVGSASDDIRTSADFELQ